MDPFGGWVSIVSHGVKWSSMTWDDLEPHFREPSFASMMVIFQLGLHPFPILGRVVKRCFLVLKSSVNLTNCCT